MHPLSSLNCTSMKHSRGWRTGSGSLPPPCKGQKLSVNIAACSNLLLINPINNPKVLHHKIHTKDTILQYAIHGRRRKDNPFICSIFYVLIMPRKAILGASSLILQCWGKPSLLLDYSNHQTAFRRTPTQSSSIWNMFNSFSEFLLMPNLWEARRTYAMWPDSLLYRIMKALWAIIGSRGPEFENLHFLVRFSNHCFVKKRKSNINILLNIKISFHMPMLRYIQHFPICIPSSLLLHIVISKQLSVVLSSMPVPALLFIF